ncbi:nascent polypeptide-associated complex subunit alpha, muscle-specific form isoform X1 [Conger conger]|uniref:nascent polypeptide-associated complex subunit alpha, muscle-specific form isoform X1 n=1 Tax=Conger conger TaxID=82655 RepID=UPI002A5AEE4A|nr:nascent polypeptide-associated complex subunit alpha, muscle-specific form isoform X1 [Conger conger]
MSETSVNDHLEGILSDFEALKRSFDIEDEIPAYSPSPAHSSPFSPTPNSNRTNDGRGPANHTPPPYQSRLSINPSPAQSPVLRNKIVTSLSFNRGTAEAGVRANGNAGSGISRASSFQSRFNPNGFSTSGLGSHNDSLRSSSSSLDSQASISKQGHSGSASPAGLPQGPMGRREFKTTGLVGPALKKFSSHGNVFRSEVEVSSVPAGEPTAVIHGSMPSLDLQGSGSRGVASLVDRFGQTGGTWSASASRLQGGAHSPRHLTPKPKEVAKLNKFPLDLENLAVKPQAPSAETPSPPKPPPRFHPKPAGAPSPAPAGALSPAPAGALSPAPAAPTPAPAGPSMPVVGGTSGVDPGLSPGNGLIVEPVVAPGPFRVPAVMVTPVPLSPAQTPELSLITRPQVVQLSPSDPLPPASLNVPKETCQESETVGSPEQEASQTNESIVSPDEEVPQANESVGPPDKEVAQANDSIVLPDMEVPQAIESVQTPDKELPRANESTDKEGPLANESVDLPHKQVPQGNENIVPPDEELSRANKSTESPEKEVPGANENIVSPSQEVPRANESVGSILQRIASFSCADGTGPGPKEDNRHGNKDKTEGPDFQQKEEREEDVPAPALEPEIQIDEKEEEPEEPAPPACPKQPSPEGYITGHQMFGYVGIEAVLDQMRRKAMKTGFEFNIMVVGQSGLGKSTLVNTLFKSKVSRKSCTPNYEEKICKTVNLQSVSHVIEERGVKMKLTVIDTPGFGDQINNENCWEPIVKYINEQYEKYLKEELNINRKRRIPDTRVHCCVYFLPATGHWLRPLDVEFMKRLGLIVSIVPVIAKADTLTIEERLEFKQRIRKDLQTNGIRVYPQTEYDEDGDDRIMNDKIREKIPFAVVGTDKEHQVNGNKVLGRKTKWGIIEVENVAHCEFANLRDLLIRSHLQDLKDVTHNIHYETYRVRRLNESNLNGLGISALSPVNGVTEKSEAESNL